jgi:hypothetical protein
VNSTTKDCVTGFDFPDFKSAWDALAGVSAANLSAAQERGAKSALRAAMWPNGDGPRHFSNLTHFICGDAVRKAKVKKQ